MEIRNCKRCGKIFNYVDAEVCERCSVAEQSEFVRIREYLYDNPNSTVAQVNRATGVDIRVITRFLREGRLEKSPHKAD